MQPQSHMQPLSPMSTDPAPTPVTGARALTDVVTAVPGVLGREPGIATTLRTLDARLRRATPSPATGDVVVEISVGGPLPVRSVVEEVQRAVQLAAGVPVTGRPEVLVRVQSLGAP